MSEDGDAERALALARVDSLMAKTVEWVAPISFRIARSEEDRQAVYRMRYQAVIERGWLKPEDLPGGFEADEYDIGAVHVMAWDGEVLAASSRLVLPEPGRKLPTEEAFDLAVEPRGQVVDAGRFVVAKAYSTIQHRMLSALVARTWLQARALGYSHACAAFTSAAMIRVYRHMGIKITVLGPAKRYWGTDRYPVSFEAADSLPSLVERWPGMFSSEPNDC